MPSWNDAQLLEVIELVPNTSLFRLSTNDEMNRSFVPGQFITLELPISDKRRDRWRSYSINNIPAQDGYIELCIVHLDGGKGTEYLFNELQVGQTIKYKGPQGMFTIPKKEYDNVVLICTGTGIAPFKSMLDFWSMANNRPPFDVHLIFGTRVKNSILFLSQMQEMDNTCKWFKYSVALSREKETFLNTPYNEGYVHAIYREQYTGTTEENLFMICGWTKMVDEAVMILEEEMKIHKSKIVYELYG